MSIKLDIIEKISGYLTIFIILFFFTSMFSYAFLSSKISFIQFMDEYMMAILWASILPPFYYFLNDLPALVTQKGLKMLCPTNNTTHMKLYYYYSISNNIGMNFLIISFLFSLYYAISITSSSLVILALTGLILYVAPIIYVFNYAYKKTKKENI